MLKKIVQISLQHNKNVEMVMNFQKKNYFYKNVQNIKTS